MHISISRKVFIIFSILTLITIFLGSTVFFGLKQLEDNRKEIRTLYDFKFQISELGHFHSNHNFHLNISDLPLLENKIEATYALAHQIINFKGKKTLPADLLAELNHLDDFVLYYKDAAIELIPKELLREAMHTQAITEMQLLFTVLQNQQKKVPQKAFELFSSAEKIIYRHEYNTNPSHLKQLKDIRRQMNRFINDANFTIAFDKVVSTVEQDYFNELAILDRTDFLSTTSSRFYTIANRTIAELTIQVEKTRKQIQHIILAIIIMTALITFWLWALSTRRIRAFLDNFHHSLNFIRKGKYDYKAPPVYSDELGDAILFMKEMADDLQEKIQQRELVELDKEKLQEQLIHSQKMESVGLLAGGIAHDFNNILTGINGYCELALLKLPEDDPAREYFKIILASGFKATALTKQLLTFSRKQVLEKKIVNLNPIILNITKMLQRMLGDDITLEIKTPDKIGNILADTSQLEQILLNLSVNARDSMPSGGRLTIETSEIYIDEEYAKSRPDVKPGMYITLSVTDTGLGIPKEIQHKIFDPFFTTKAPGKGTGLGLATVFGIVKQHNGHIWLYSEENHGTTFKIYFPLIDKGEELPAVPEQPAFMTGDQTILVVDDNEDVLQLVKESLSHHGFHVISSSDPVDALEQLDSYNGTIHLLLTDVIMPGMNGKELANAAIKKRPNLKVVFMSGYSDHIIMQEEIENNPDLHFIQKPVTPTQLMNTLREIF
ncbi:MAG: response regulator [Proteobacteria bacterium]|nr:response regulator [Pseudomonadota bacterium]MBU1709234.1 response regulator [Pseudomonadota bacterium]